MRSLPQSFRIGRRNVGAGHPCYVIAEAGSNHNGRQAIAFELIDVAAEAGCDAVKFQVFDADRLMTVDGPRAAYLDGVLDAEESLHALFSRTALDRAMLPLLADHSRGRGIDFVATPFDIGAVAALIAPEVNVPALKNASSELWDIPLIEAEARTGRPLILSTGMAEIDDVRVAVSSAIAAGASAVALLHCTVSYPTAAPDLNLMAIDTLRSEFGIPVGLSDHTLGVWAPTAAVAKGASLIEKHFTLDRHMDGPDHRFALEPNELAEMVQSIRNVELGLGDGQKLRRPCEDEIYAIGRRNIVAARNLSPGETIRRADVEVLRSELGIEPSRLPELLGRQVRRPVSCGRPLQWEDLSSPRD